MSVATRPPRVIFPDRYDDRAESEATARGYLNHVTVELDDGNRFELEFWDHVRLQQDLATLAESGQTVFAEPNMVILPEITTDAVKDAVQQLWRTGYFERLRPPG
jgi:hypothetical protein